MTKPNHDRQGADWRRWAACAVVSLVIGCARTSAPEPAAKAERETKPESVRSLTVAVRKESQRSFTEFRPSKHGFAFVNDFSGSMVPGAAALGLPSRFGLCGGMSTAAADYFLARKAVPPDTAPPKEGTDLYRYLYSRQAASNGTLGAMGVKFLEWMQLSDEEVSKRTREELALIVSAVKRGDPVVIGEVLQRVGGGKAWENHQVLGYLVDDAGGETRIRIYDPNMPKRDDVVIRVREEGGLLKLTRMGGGRRDMAIRGVFRMPYSRVEPR